jgi:DNA-binding NtrC family response regulator
MIEGDFTHGAQRVTGNAAGISADLSRLENQTPAENPNALCGDSAAVKELMGQLRKAAASSSSVLLVGENGSGKELAARYLHDASTRANEPFVVLDCVAAVAERLPAELLAQIDSAGAGTLVIDEVTGLPLDLQLRLANALESDQIRCRLLATTTADAQQAVAEGRLRADLLYRLAVFAILVPPLRQRDSDVELLAHAYLQALNEAEGASKRFSPDSLTCLRRYSWPGNVWELRNVVHRAYALADEELDLRSVAGKPLLPSANGDEQALRIPVGTNLAEAERWMIIATLKKCGGNKTRAAALLGVSLKTLYNRLNTYRAQGQDLSDIDGELTEVAV